MRGAVVAIMVAVCVGSSCTPAEEATDTEGPLMGELLSYEEIPERCCAMRFHLRYTNELDDRAFIECRFEVQTTDGNTYPRWVTSPEVIEPGESLTFSATPGVGWVDSIDDLSLTSCREAPD